MKKYCRIITTILLTAALGCSGITTVPVLADTVTETGIPYEKGLNTATGFESKWLNMRFTPASYLVMATDEEILDLMGLGADMIESNSGTSLDFENYDGAVYEMMASSTSGYPNVIVMTEQAVLKNLTIDQYMESAKSLMESSDMGYSFDKIDEPVELAGFEYKEMDATVSYDGLSVYQAYLTRRQDDKFVSIIISFTEDTYDQASEIIASFSNY